MNDDVPLGAYEAHWFVPSDPSEDMSEGKYAKGGLVSGGSVSMSIERVGVCANGHHLYRFMDGMPEHVISAAEIKAGDYSQVLCEETIPKSEEP